MFEELFEGLKASLGAWKYVIFDKYKKFPHIFVIEIRNCGFHPYPYPDSAKCLDPDLDSVNLDPKHWTRPKIIRSRTCTGM
jgi:hypothetical protein